MKKEMKYLGTMLHGGTLTALWLIASRYPTHRLLTAAIAVSVFTLIVWGLYIANHWNDN
jgi:hypothetical protein